MDGVENAGIGTHLVDKIRDVGRSLDKRHKNSEETGNLVDFLPSALTLLLQALEIRHNQHQQLHHQRKDRQNEAVTAVAHAIRRGRVGLKDPKRPTGSFIFLGPTGVGKTELSKALAEILFGDENSMIRIDMATTRVDSLPKRSAGIPIPSSCSTR